MDQTEETESNTMLWERKREGKGNERGEEREKEIFLALNYNSQYKHPSPLLTLPLSPSSMSALGMVPNFNARIFW